MNYEVIVDHKETAKKCTILPLRYREDFRIARFRGESFEGPLTADILLHPDGISMDKLASPLKDTVTKIAALDCVWRRLETIVRGIGEPVPTLVKIPDGFETAYPRKSKLTTDPTGGFATIEAIFIAAAFLGHWDTSLLKEYYFGEQFLEMNSAVLRQYGIEAQ